MHFITTDERIVPCKYDQGSDCYVVNLRDFDPEDEELFSLIIDDEEVDFVDYEIIDTTIRVCFIYVYYDEEDADDESSESSSLEDYESDESDFDSFDS